MKIGEVVICWTPNTSEFPAGFRGKARIFTPTMTTQEAIAPFARRAGKIDPRAHDSREEVRQAYALMIAIAMSERDGLDLARVHQLMLSIDEYASGCAEELPQASHSGQPSI